MQRFVRNSATRRFRREFTGACCFTSRHKTDSAVSESATEQISTDDLFKTVLANLKARNAEYAKGGQIQQKETPKNMLSGKVLLPKPISIIPSESKPLPLVAAAPQPNIPRNQPNTSINQANGRPSFYAAFSSIEMNKIKPLARNKTKWHASARFIPVYPRNEAPAHLDMEKPVPLPRLAHKLERVLTERGIHTLQGRNNKFHYSRFLRDIHQPHEINPFAFAPFVTTSKDSRLNSLALQNSCKYKASTSSISPPLTHLYFVFSNFKHTFSYLLPHFGRMTPNFVTSARKPASIVVRPMENQGVVTYSIDSHKIDSSRASILLSLGKSLEKMLVMEPEDFLQNVVKGEHLHKDIDHPEEAYRYMKYGRILMRSQLDCYSPLLKGESKVFDIKTRAILPIRMNIEEYAKQTHHKLISFRGENSSYEREIYDLVRSVFIKYSFQARIGGMDGMFIAYHNTKNIFGFEYIGLEDIDKYVFGSSHMARTSFYAILSIFENFLDTITEIWPMKSVQLTFQSVRTDPYFINVFAEPLEKDSGWKGTNDYSHLTPEDLARSNPFALKFVHCFRIGIQVFVNNVLQTNFVEFQEDDKVDVSYTVIDRGSSNHKPELIEEYSEALKEQLMISGKK